MAHTSLVPRLVVPPADSSSTARRPAPGSVGALSRSLLVFGLAVAAPALAIDGLPDPGFGWNGGSLIAWDRGGALSDWVRDADADGDGHLFLVGDFDSTVGDADWGVTELDPGGVTVASQYLVFDLGGTNADVPVGVRLDGAGGLLIAGYALGATSSEVRLCRLRTSDLALDPGFANGAGCAAYAYLSAPLYPVALARAGDGGWLIAGTLDWGAGDRDFFVLKFTAAGLLDTSFNPLDPFHPGMAVVPVDLVAQGADGARALAVDHLGRILVAGDVESATAGNAAAVVRLTAGGVLDPAFGSSGVQTWAYFDGLVYQHTWAMSVAVDPVLDTFVVGYSHDHPAASEVAAAVGHFDAGGNWQNFPGSGSAVRYVTWLAGTGNWLERVLYQSDGRILAVGDSSSGQNYQVTRLLADGTFDLTYGSFGTTTYSPSAEGWGTGHGVASALLSAGRLVVLGTVSNPDDDWLAVRFTNDLIFRDGFETGNRSHWSGGVP